MTSIVRHVVEIDEAVVKNERAGREWLEAFLIAYRNSTRVAAVRGAGNVLRVACVDSVHASTLRGRMLAEGLPKRAVWVRKVRS